MKDIFSFRDAAIFKFPCHAMSAKSFCMSVIPNKTIGMLSLESRSSPHPTSSKFFVSRMNWPVFVDFFPKSFQQWDLYKMPVRINSHELMISSMGIMSEVVNAIGSRKGNGVSQADS